MSLERSNTLTKLFLKQLFFSAAVWNARNSRPEVFYKTVVLTNFTKFSGKHLCQSLFLNKVVPATLLKKETLAQVFSCEFCEIFKNTFFYRTPPVAASEMQKQRQWLATAVNDIWVIWCNQIFIQDTINYLRGSFFFTKNSRRL